MGLFGKNRDELIEEEEIEEKLTRKFKDLKPENKKKRKEPPKPWGKRERYTVLTVLLATMVVSGILSVSARNYKLPGFPRIKLSGFTLSNPFEEQIITIGGKKEDSDMDVKAATIQAKFREKTNNLSGLYALYIIDLKSGRSFGVNENEVMQAASLIKLPVMYFAIGQVDDGKIEAMGKRSDNAVFNEMVKKFGKTGLQNYINNLGMVNTSISENTTTPKEIGDLFEKIYKESINQNPENSKKLLEYMTETTFENWLKRGVPSEIRVAHKYGRELHVINDAGVVYAENPYIVVIMTDGVIEKEADILFPELSKLVYDEMQEK